jgi:DNA-binding transcriptional ArsR family regulator
MRASGSQATAERLDRLEARVERLERRGGVLPEGEGRGGEGPSGGETPAAPAGRPAPGDLGFGRWLQAQHRPGHTLVALGVVRDRPQGGSTMRSSLIKRRADEFDADLRAVARLCQALASESRLALLRELAAGTRTTAELVAATGVERSQLYHHLRDLFVQGLVEQPERGRYAATDGGAMVFLAADALHSLIEPAEHHRDQDFDAAEMDREAPAGGPAQER